jgi:hypothetical protein
VTFLRLKGLLRRFVQRKRSHRLLVYQYYVLVFEPRTRTITSIEPQKTIEGAEARRAELPASPTEDARVAILGRFSHESPANLENDPKDAAAVLAIILHNESKFSPHHDPPLAA